MEGIYQDRIRRAKDRITAAYALEKTEELPVIIQTTPYMLFLVEKKKGLEEYFTNPHTMMNYQKQGAESHMKHVEDDYVPYLMPWYGTVVLPSAFGCQVKWSPYNDPLIQNHCIDKLADAENLQLPDPQRDGLLPTVLRTIDVMRKEGGLPVGITNIQGPLDTASDLCGKNMLYFEMYRQPSLVHSLLRTVTEATIDWIKVQKEHAGEAVDETFSQGVWQPKGCGVGVGDHCAVELSAPLYKEFGVPYTSRVLKAFGGGYVHFDGDGTHQIDNFLHMEGLKALNVCPMGDLSILRKLKDAFRNKLCIIFQETAHVDIEDYYRRAVDVLAPDGGAIISIFASETQALSETGNIQMRRNPTEVAKRILAVAKAHTPS